VAKIRITGNIGIELTGFLVFGTIRVPNLPLYLRGELAERLNAAVLKTVDL
jgi:hypothetical protein